jgi:hypothetical protein
VLRKIELIVVAMGGGEYGWVCSSMALQVQTDDLMLVGTSKASVGRLSSIDDHDDLQLCQLEHS